MSSFKGIKGYIVYLTEHEAVGDISDSIRIIQERNNNTGNKVFHLRWHMLYKTLEKMNSIFSSYEKVIVKDLMEYLEKLGLRDFSGISLPDDALANAFAIPFPVFYREDQKDKKTYFDLVNERDLKFQKFVFYGGNVNE